jgi:uncharacterized damage-inducible protein DinB
VNELTTLLDEALEAWEEAREGVLAESEVIPDDRWDFRPAPVSRTVTELVRHIIESGLLMSGELSRTDGDFRRKEYAALLAEHASGVPEGADPAGLREMLGTAHERGAAALRAAGELHMLQHIRRFDGKLGTRLAWMEHGVAHEYYHRGQLALYVRQMGLVPALTRAIHGEG